MTARTRDCSREIEKHKGKREKKVQGEEKIILCRARFDKQNEIDTEYIPPPNSTLLPPRGKRLVIIPLRYTDPRYLAISRAHEEEFDQRNTSYPVRAAASFSSAVDFYPLETEKRIDETELRISRN